MPKTGLLEHGFFFCWIKLRTSEKMYRKHGKLNLLTTYVTTYYSSSHAIGPSIKWPYVAKMWTVYEVLIINLKIYIKAS